jgi:hypothetical protein
MFILNQDSFTIYLPSFAGKLSGIKVERWLLIKAFIPFFIPLLNTSTLPIKLSV